MCQWVEEVRERLRHFSSESLPLFFLVMWVVVIGVVGSAVIVKILDIFFPTCEHKWVCFMGFVSEQIICWNIQEVCLLLTSFTWLYPQNHNFFFLLFRQAHFPHKPCHSDAGWGEAHSAGEHRNWSRGGREETLNWLGQPLYFQFVLICSLTLVTVLRCQHGLVLSRADIQICELLGFVFRVILASGRISCGTGGGLKPSNWLFNAGPRKSLKSQSHDQNGKESEWFMVVSCDAAESPCVNKHLCKQPIICTENQTLCSCDCSGHRWLCHQPFQVTS